MGANDTEGEGMEDETPPGEADAVPQEITLSGGLTLPPLAALFKPELAALFEPEGGGSD